MAHHGFSANIIIYLVKILTFGALMPFYKFKVRIFRYLLSSYVFKHFKIVLEPGGAVALAAAISEKVKIKNKNVLVIASGGNVDKNIFENCLKTETI